MPPPSARPRRGAPHRSGEKNIARHRRNPTAESVDEDVAEDASLDPRSSSETPSQDPSQDTSQDGSRGVLAPHTVSLPTIVGGAHSSGTQRAVPVKDASIPQDNVLWWR